MADNFKEFVNKFFDPTHGFAGQETAFLNQLHAYLQEVDNTYPVLADDIADSLTNNCFIKNIILDNIKSIVIEKLSPYQLAGEPMPAGQAYQSLRKVLHAIEEKQAALTTLLNREKSTRYFLGISIPGQAIWEELFIHYCSLLSTTPPSQQWLKLTQQLLHQIGTADYLPRAILWMEKALEKSIKYKDRWQYFDREVHTKELKLDGYHPEPWMLQIYTHEREFHTKGRKRWEWQEPNNGQFYFYYTFGGRFLRGIILSAAFLDSRPLFEAIEKFAIANPGESNDAIVAFSLLPPKEAIDRLSRLLNQIKKPKVKQKIEKVIQTLSQA